MPLQSQVNIQPPIAYNGDLSDASAASLFEHNPPMRAAVNIPVGVFVWNAGAPAGADLERQDQAWATNVGSAGVVPEGIVWRNRIAIQESNQNVATAFAAGSYLPVKIAGGIYIVSATAPTVGYKAFATIATGAVVFGAAGATVSGAIETAFVVKSVRPQNNGATTGYLVNIVK